MRILAVSLAIVMAACSPGAGSSGTIVADRVSCQDPPRSETQKDSRLSLTVDPNPASPRETVSLSVSSKDLPADALAGVDAAWECWTGSRWVTTHIVYRGFGDHAGQTIPVNQSFQIRVPSIGLPLDVGFPIVIPQVEPGIYRIEDEIITEDSSVPGFVIIEVTGNDQSS